MSSGCTRCYAEVQAARIVRMGKGKPTPYDELVKLVGGEPRWTGKVVLDPQKLAEPLRWRTPRRVFVDSMSDLFYEGFSNEQIAAVYGVMAATPHITYQVLTKRARRRREWFAWVDGWPARTPAELTARAHGPSARDRIEAAMRAELRGVVDGTPRRRDARWPLPNVWEGTSVENQDAADERIPDLLATPASVRFLSCEPLLGPVDLRAWLFSEIGRRLIGAHPGLSWVIAGCESGPGARPCDVSWLRSLRDQCAAAGVAFWLKQARYVDGPRGTRSPILSTPPLADLTLDHGSRHKPGGVIELPYLDGVQHAEFPADPGQNGDR